MGSADSHVLSLFSLKPLIFQFQSDIPLYFMLMVIMTQHGLLKALIGLSHDREMPHYRIKLSACVPNWHDGLNTPLSSLCRAIRSLDFLADEASSLFGYMS